MVEPNDVERSHDDFRELLGAYALGAVTPDERRAVAEHLTTCDECPAELAQLRAAVHALPLALEDREPSPALRDRIEATIRQELANGRGQEGGRPAAVLPGPQLPTTATRPLGRSNLRRLPVPPWAAAAIVLLALSLGVLIWNLQLRQAERPEPAETIALQPAEAAPGTSAQLTYLEDRQVMIVAFRDLPALSPGQVYQLWLFRGDVPIPSGVFGPSRTECAVAADPAEYRALAVTREPGPLGSPGPTGEPIFQAPLGPA